MDYREFSEPDIIAILGGRFREYRLNCQMTQKELAQHAGISSKVQETVQPRPYRMRR